MSVRPWCCPEPRCNPLLNMRDGSYPDPSVPVPGNSIFCWGLMPNEITFVYDGVTHANDRSFCLYTPLKGAIRYQTTENDWSVLASGSAVALDIAKEARDE